MWNYGLQILILFALVLENGYGRDCENNDKCSCYNTAQEYEFQCPPDNFKIVIHSMPNKYIKIDCYSLTRYDIDIFPKFNAWEAEYFKMQDCPLPDDNFQPTLQKFNVSQLKKLDLDESRTPQDSSRKSVSNDLFEGLSSLEILSLSLLKSKLDANAFQNLPNLTQLYLEKNEFTEIGYMFENQSKLKVLHLSRNYLRDIPDGLFKNLPELQQLHLWRNNLTTISKSYFRGLKHLKSLELSLNNINSIDSDSFSELTELVNISLRSNKIKSLSRDLFKNNVMLEGVRIGVNPDIMFSDYFFANLPRLKNINMERSRLKTVPENIFSGSANITNLIMSNNEISELPENVFKSQNKLKKLDLSYNKIMSLPSKVFSSLKELEELNLEQNMFTDISDKLFESLENLKYLSLKMNQIITINLGAFNRLHKMTKLDLSYNMYNMSYMIYGLTPFSYCEDLEYLDLSHNLLTDFPDGVLYKIKFKLLNASYNKINQLDVSSLIKISSYPVQVDLRYNEISTVDFSQIKVVANQNIEKYDAMHNNETSTLAIMSGNPFICDCRNFELVQYMQDKLEPLSIKTMVDIRIGDTLCDQPEDFKHIPVADLSPPLITCEYPNKHCPADCSCFKRPYDNITVVDCSFRNLTVFPEITFCDENIELNLSGNYIDEGPDKKLGYASVKNLFVSNNRMKTFNWVPENIEILKLDGNQLVSIGSDVLKALNVSKHLKQLTMSNNPWSCDCSALQLQNFIKTKYDKVSTTDVRCKEDNTLLIEKKEVCKSNTLLVSILVPILSILLVTAVALVFYYRYNNEIKVWLYAKNLCLWFVTEEEVDKDKLYDVFISFSHKDEDFVLQNLLPVLETGPTPYKICIHVRDWLPGEFITDQVANSVANSRRTLVVLSNNFLESVWGKLEFKTAHTQAIEEGRARVILVKYGELDETKLDKDLQAYLKTNTYVEWGKPWFWNKLKYALPHSRQPNFYQQNQRHASVMLKIDDKFELTSQPITHPESTPPVISMDPLDPALLKNHPLNFNTAINIQTPPAEAPLINR